MHNLSSILLALSMFLAVSPARAVEPKKRIAAVLPVSTDTDLSQESLLHISTLARGALRSTLRQIEAEPWHVIETEEMNVVLEANLGDLGTCDGNSCEWDPVPWK